MNDIFQWGVRDEMILQMAYDRTETCQKGLHVCICLAFSL
jgi:hypothetical protein